MLQLSFPSKFLLVFSYGRLASRSVFCHPCGTIYYFFPSFYLFITLIIKLLLNFKNRTLAINYYLSVLPLYVTSLRHTADSSVCYYLENCFFLPLLNLPNLGLYRSKVIKYPHTALINLLEISTCTLKFSI